MIFTVYQISSLEIHPPIEILRLRVVWSKHIAIFIKRSVLVVVVIKKLYFEFSGLNHSYLAARPSSLSWKVAEFEHVYQIPFLQLLYPSAVCLPDEAMGETLLFLINTL